MIVFLPAFDSKYMPPKVVKKLTRPIKKVRVTGDMASEPASGLAKMVFE